MTPLSEVNYVVQQRMGRNDPRFLLVVSVLLITATSWPSESQVPTAAAELASKGTVTLVGGEELPGEPCSGSPFVLRVQREGGGEINGPICVTGVSAFAGGSMGDAHWTVTGGAISGTLKRDSGQVIATFTGTATQEGISGSFTTAGGRTGSWRWDGETASAQ